MFWSNRGLAWTGGLAIVCSVALIGALNLRAAPEGSFMRDTGTSPKIPDDVKTSGFALGCQAWTFNHFTVFEAIAKTEQAGGKVIEFFPGQALSPDRKNEKFDHNASDDVLHEVQEQLAKHHL